MQSTLTPQDTDPHDAFVIEPDVVLAAREPSPDPVRELLSHLAQKRTAETTSGASAVAPTPAVETPKIDAPRLDTPRFDPPKFDMSSVDTTFRAAALDTIDTTDRPAAPDDRPGIGWWLKRSFIAFMFALCSAFAAAAWTHHGAAARQMISSWLPPYVLAALPMMEKPVTAEQPDSEPVQAAASAERLARESPQSLLLAGRTTPRRSDQSAGRGGRSHDERAGA